jgi:hypothetical protein
LFFPCRLWWICILSYNIWVWSARKIVMMICILISPSSKLHWFNPNAFPTICSCQKLAFSESLFKKSPSVTSNAINYTWTPVSVWGQQQASSVAGREGEHESPRLTSPIHDPCGFKHRGLCP